MNDAAIKALAAYFTGNDVALNSIGLTLPPSSQAHINPLDLRGRADRFFAASDALGITGWANVAEAEAAIRKTLEKV